MQPLGRQGPGIPQGYLRQTVLCNEAEKQVQVFQYQADHFFIDSTDNLEGESLLKVKQLPCRQEVAMQTGRFVCCF